MANKDYSIRQEQLARFAKAMGHPARIAILQFLAKQETCYFGDIHEELPIAKATVSQHLKELKDAGLIQGEVEAPKVKYCIIGWLIKNISYICDIKNENIMAFTWKSHATLTLLAKQDLAPFGYNMIDPLKSWCWGSILFYPFKISRFS